MILLYRIAVEKNFSWRFSQIFKKIFEIENKFTLEMVLENPLISGGDFIREPLIYAKRN